MKKILSYISLFLVLTALVFFRKSKRLQNKVVQLNEKINQAEVVSAADKKLDKYRNRVQQKHRQEDIDENLNDTDSLDNNW